MNNNNNRISKLEQTIDNKKQKKIMNLTFKSEKGNSNSEYFTSTNNKESLINSNSINNLAVKEETFDKISSNTKDIYLDNKSPSINRSNTNLFQFRQMSSSTNSLNFEGTAKFGKMSSSNANSLNFNNDFCNNNNEHKDKLEDNNGNSINSAIYHKKSVLNHIPKQETLNNTAHNKFYSTNIKNPHEQIHQYNININNIHNNIYQLKNESSNTVIRYQGVKDLNEINISNNNTGNIESITNQSSRNNLKKQFNLYTTNPNNANNPNNTNANNVDLGSINTHNYLNNFNNSSFNTENIFSNNMNNLDRTSSVIQELYVNNNNNANTNIDNSNIAKKEKKIRGLYSLSQDFYNKLSSDQLNSRFQVKVDYDIMNKKAMENCKHLFSNSNKRNKNITNDSISLLNNDSSLSKFNIERMNINSYLENNSHTLNVNRLNLIENEMTETINDNHINNTINVNNTNTSDNMIKENFNNQYNPYHHKYKYSSQSTTIKNLVNRNASYSSYRNFNQPNNSIDNNNNTIHNDSMNFNSSNTGTIKHNYSNSNIFGNRARRQILNMNSNTVAEVPENTTERTNINIPAFKIQETNENLHTQGSYINTSKPLNINNLSKYKHIFTDTSASNTIGNIKESINFNTSINNSTINNNHAKNNDQIKGNSKVEERSGKSNINCNTTDL